MGADGLADVMQVWSVQVDAALGRYLQALPGCPDRLREAMRYSVFAGGKRLRPLLVLLANEACMGSADAAMPAACAVEFLHTYSLIHDDLPAMDNDDLRRGVPTCHRQFDEATAILAGDGLLTLAFGALSDLQPTAVVAQCVRALARAAGAVGMVGGQYDDLHPVGDGDLAWLQSLHARKTGALLTCSLQMGALAANADEARREALRAYGERIGLAFQIADDLLDVEGSAEKLGKGVHKDSAAGKLTYPGLLGVAESKRRARELAVAATDCLHPFGPAASRLAALAQYIIERDH